MPAARPRRAWGSFPTTADVGLWARGPTADALLEALGLALYALTTDLRTVRPAAVRRVRATATDPGALVVAYLGELLLLGADDGFVGRRISVVSRGAPPTSLSATVIGEPFDPARHPAKVEVKAITYHDLVFDPARGRARVIVDI